MPAMAEPADGASAAAPTSRLVGLLVLGLIVGTINGLSRVALPLYAASVGAQSWQVAWWAVSATPAC